MASVFLSYDHEDSARAAPIAAALETHGHSVWWDRQIHGGAEYNSEIESAVENADAVVVLWSAASVRSAWVRDEAAEGRDRGRLVPVLIEAVKPPMGFRQYQTLDLSQWTGGKRISRLDELLHAIDKVAGGAQVSSAPPPAPAPLPKPARVRRDGGRFSRRAAIGAGAGAIAAVASGGLWWSMRHRGDPRFDALMGEGRDAVATWNADAKSLDAIEQAVALRPDSAEAWGLLALLRAIAAPNSDPAQIGTAVQQAQKAAQHALSIDPKQPNALLAMFELEGTTLDWFTRDQRLRQIIAIDPKNVGAIGELVLLMQATGMCRESWEWNERAIALEPLSLDFLGKRALKLWILGRTGEADKVIDQVRALNPTDLWAWFVRIHIYAFTGRARAALALMDSEPAMAARHPMTQLWRASLPALDQPSSGAISNAREACIRNSVTAPGLANEAIALACALNLLDLAFDMADGNLLSRGPLVPRQQPGSSNAVDNAAWRIGTQWMFTPPVSPMRADPRFLPLCDGVGLTDYWRIRRARPDYMRGQP